MPFTPRYQITNKMLDYVGAIDSAREVITHAPLVPAWERRFQTEARALIIHHGTHLEGNDLNLEEVQEVLESPSPHTGRERDVQEVINYRAVMDYLDSLEGVPPTRHILAEIHRLTVKDLLSASEAGHFRSVKVVIRNNATGEITFRPPSPLEVPFYIDELFDWLNSEAGGSVHPLLRAGILHYELARIHPFTDGNGRTARAMALLLLFLEGYQVKKFFALEEYYDSHPEEYYAALQSVAPAGDLTHWLEYFTLGIS
ncbi:MAG: Fic family protein, partial [bacterium]